MTTIPSIQVPTPPEPVDDGHADVIMQAPDVPDPKALLSHMTPGSMSVYTGQLSEMDALATLAHTANSKYYEALTESAKA